jgi:hypothetical protein
MGAKQAFIEINGRRYHAETGQPLKASVESRPRPAAKNKGRQAAGHAAHHQPVTTRTLMRQAVKKPAPKGRLKAHGRIDAIARHFLAEIEKPVSITSLDEKRLTRAKHIKRSQAISRFPRLGQSPAYTPAPALIKPATRSATQPAHSKPQSTAELLEKVIQQATSHEQPPVKTRRRRGVNKRRAGAASAVALAVILMAVITGQNSTAAQLQTASAAAGFTASLPAYQPAGFKRTSLEADKGVVAVGFHGRDNLSFSITQKPAGSADTVSLTNFITDQNANFQIVRADRNTVYLYGRQNATWVSHGVWYDVHSFGSLDDHQLIMLAASS